MAAKRRLCVCSTCRSSTTKDESGNTIAGQMQYPEVIKKHHMRDVMMDVDEVQEEEEEGKGNRDQANRPQSQHNHGSSAQCAASANADDVEEKTVLSMLIAPKAGRSRNDLPVRMRDIVPVMDSNDDIQMDTSSDDVSASAPVSIHLSRCLV